MATSIVGSAGPKASLPVLLLCLVSVVSGDTATIYSMPQLETWAENSLMSLELSVPDGGDYTLSKTSVLPLTSSIGLNQSQTVRGYQIYEGNMFSADTTNYVNVTSHQVAYLDCDSLSNSSNISPTMMINTIMSNSPKAILLYSLKNACCGLMGSNLNYQIIFTMIDQGDAADTLNLTLMGGIKATISGNASSPSSQSSPQDNSTGNNSAVAMSILYSITGLITLLFLIIIATGAIRAHRYPERYGPRSGFGGRPRQSRAKGLARAVLETLPIVKFGDPAPPAKQDPEQELENQPERTSQDATTGVARLSAIPEEPQAAHLPKTQANETHAASDLHSQRLSEVPEASGAAGSTDEHLGCSICTEDFLVGEDVRVLPCDHKFHPPCIDPWLVNISGTCPLCRLDLRPQADRENAVTAEDMLQLPPPLDADGQEPSQGTPVDHNEHNISNASRSNRRASRILDLQRLRHASVEERIEILRRHRSQQQPDNTNPTTPEEERSRHARLADRLRDKFRIRTRTQSAE